MRAISRRAGAPSVAATPRDETTRDGTLRAGRWRAGMSRFLIGRYALLLVALALHVALFLLVFPNAGEDQVLHGNLWLFYRDGGRALSGAVPYRDFLFEYPPGALVVMALPRLFAVGYLQYRTLFFVECAVLDAAIVVALYSAARATGLPAWRVLGLYTLAVVLLGPLADYRIDLAPAALTALALAAWLRRHDGAAAVLLAAGTATKLYPGLLLPVLLMDVWRRGPRAALRAATLFALTLGLLLSPVLLVTPAQLARDVQFQTGRHLQVESLWAVPVLLLHLARWLPLEIVARGRALVILGPGDALGALGTPLLLLVAVAIYWHWWQSRLPVHATDSAKKTASGEDAANRSWAYTESSPLLIGSAALVVAATILNKVLSPQYLIWAMAPLALLPLRPRATIVTLCAFIAALPLTQWLYPLHYGELVQLISPLTVAILGLRDLLLLIALVAVLVAYWRIRHPATSRKL